MSTPCRTTPFDASIIAIDLEIHPVSRALLTVGGHRPGRDPFRRSATLEDPQRILRDLWEYADGAAFLLGHNVLAHDLDWLKAHDPSNPLHALPVIDTLVLSPLAWPGYPYHRLWKGYKLTESSRNDPLRDSEAALGLFHEQIDKLGLDPLLPAFLGLLRQDARTAGCAQALTLATGVSPLPTREVESFLWDRLAGKACRHAWNALWEGDPPRLGGEWLPFALAAAWLSVAGSASRLAPWVAHAFPETVEILRRLRQQPCEERCPFCLDVHSADEALRRFFHPFTEFRPILEGPPPVTQREVVEALLRGEDCLVVLPTGGGKSLCYQLPALMKARQRNLLTLIVSPLQALMKDQVDALIRRGLVNVGAVNGLLSLFERSETLEKIALGEIDILWAAPEQMRNRSFRDAVAQREIGLVVVDEAHCLSKWGHDFRPDYLFLCSFLKEVLGEERALPPIACFTATAKADVIEEITGYFRHEAGKELRVIHGGAERPNLRFYVHALDAPRDLPRFSKLELALAILRESLRDGGGAILFTATRKGAEQWAERIRAAGFSAEFFHGGRTPEDKRRVQDEFLAGRTQVMCATNAFGMGVDKADVRAVIHMEVPGSLENYLQEAGRAGRDQGEAHCHLIFATEDLETQFQLCMDSRIGYGDLVGIFRGIRNLARKHRTAGGEIVRTTGEILRDEETATESIDAQEPMADTKVKIAIAWLEKLDRLERSWNRTAVIEAKPVPPTLDAALEQVRALDLPPHARSAWGRLLRVLYRADADDLLNTDALSSKIGETPGSLIAMLREMRKVGLISHAVHCTALFTHAPGKPEDAARRWAWFTDLETCFLSHLERTEAWADQEIGTLDAREAATTLATELPAMANIRARDIFLLLKIWRRDGLVAFTPQGFDRCSLTRRKAPAAIRTFLSVRQKAGAAFLEAIRTKCPRSGREQRVAFSVEELEPLLPPVEPARTQSLSFAAVKTVLLSLDDAKALTMQNGLAVFRPALTLKLRDERPPGAKDCQSLEEFFDEKIAQIHVMGQYAEFGKTDIRGAMAMVRDYFSLSRREFYDRYFHRRKELLHLPTGAESLAKITGKASPGAPPQDAALSEEQRAIVTEGKTRNILVLAGPGSGKTKALVHRAAWLVRVQRAPWGAILVVAFNRATVLEIRRRLRALLGRDSGRVVVCTYHGLALRIASRSMAILAVGSRAAPQARESLMQHIVKDAVRALESVRGEARDAMTEGLVGRVRYILVDEYQDINEEQFRMIALLARKDEPDAERDVRLFAVGDDDQNIYAWNGSDVKFIRQFEADYHPAIHRLCTNYRSSEPITAFCERFIRRLPGRMKEGIELTSGRQATQPDGIIRQPLVLRVPAVASLDAAVLAEVERRHAEGFAWEEIAILAFHHADLFRWQVLFERRGISTHLIRRLELSLPKVRELRRLITFLETQPDEPLTNAAFRKALADARNPARSRENPWEGLVDHLIDDYLGETSHPSFKDFRHFIHDVGRELRMGELRRPGRVTLATMHASKGLEFPAVVAVLANLGTDAAARRVAYVAMTRAKDALSVIGVRGRGALAEEIFAHEPFADFPEAPDRAGEDVRVWELGLKDIYLSFAGRSADHEWIAAAIDRMDHGTTGVLDRGRIRVDGVEVCRLSKAARVRLAEEFGAWRATEVVCHAIVSRSRSEEQAETQAGIRRAQWEIPLFRLVFHPARERQPFS